MTSATFDLKADAQRFVAEMETDKFRGTWIDPRHAEVPLAQWAQEFLALARRLSPTTQQSYRRDLTKYCRRRSVRAGLAASHRTPSRTGSTMSSRPGGLGRASPHFTGGSRFLRMGCRGGL